MANNSDINKIIEINVQPLLQKINELQAQVDHEACMRRCLENKVNLVERHLDDANQYSQRLNLLIENLPLRRNQKPEDMKEIVLQEAQRLKLGLNRHDIDRVHRIYDSYIVDGWRYQPTIIRFTSFTARDKFWQARKDTKWRISPHLTARREEIFHQAKELVDKPFTSHHDEPKSNAAIHYVFVDRNCRFQAKAANGRLYGFSTITELINLTAWATEQPQTFDPLDSDCDDSSEATAPGRKGSPPRMSRRRSHTPRARNRDNRRSSVSPNRWFHPRRSARIGTNQPTQHDVGRSSSYQPLEDLDSSFTKPVNVDE